MLVQIVTISFVFCLLPDICTKIAEDGQFKLHDWSCTPDNSAFKAQVFLGVTLNSTPRANLKDFDNLRALLFNCCLNGISTEGIKYFTNNGVSTDTYFTVSRAFISKLFLQYVDGKINYIKNINNRQGLILEKLKAAAEYIEKHIELGITQLLCNYKDIDKYSAYIKLEIKAYIFHNQYDHDSRLVKFEGLKTAIKCYRNNESLDVYMDRVKKIMNSIGG